MRTEASDHEEPPLERSAIYRGPQAPALQAYVPLPVFGAECMALLLCIRLVGLWALLLLPLHLILIMKTNENAYWVRDLIANYRHRWFVANKGLYGDDVVTFTPHESGRKRR